MADETDSLDVKSGPFGLKLSGPNSLLIAIFILQIAIGGLYFAQSRERQNEHKEIDCRMKLVLFMQGQQKIVEWAKVPADLYPCIPRFLYERVRE